MEAAASGSAVDVAAVVVTHESVGFLPACLQSLRDHAGGLELAVVVSDSGSTDDVESVSRDWGANFLAGPNLGFGAAANRGLRHEALRGARYVLVMNPDLTIVEGSLAELVSLCDQRPRCSVFGPRQVDQHGRLLHSIGREPTPADSWLAFRTGHETWIWNDEVYESEARGDWVMGAFMLIRRQVFEAVDGFDERFFLCCEEVDLCTKVRRAGWEVGYLPQLTIMHWKADRPLDEHRQRLISWSQLIYMRKWYGRRDRALMRIGLVARMTRKLLRRLRSRQAARAEWLRLSAALRFRRHEYGPSPFHAPRETSACSEQSR
jgi:N-acetylglucosaminyl-diphospho-decaprenol L-rhamnosyltransferase